MKRIQITKHILSKWCEMNMHVYTDWTGARVETQSNCGTIEEFVDKLWNYLEDKSNRMD